MGAGGGQARDCQACRTAEVPGDRGRAAVLFTPWRSPRYPEARFAPPALAIWNLP